MTATKASHSGPQSATGLARRTTIGVLVAVMLVLLAQSLVGVLGLEVGPIGPQTPFNVGPLVTSAVAAGVGAAVVYALLDRLTATPNRNFVVTSAVVFVLLLVPVVTLAPAMGVTPLGQVVLAVYHVLVAVPLVLVVAGGVTTRIWPEFATSYTEER